MRTFISLFAIFILLFSFQAIPAPASAALVSANTLQSGDLIRGESWNAVYYLGKDGFRYVFPQDKIFFSWYTNFDNVKWISDADLGTIQIGGNVTYKPGYTLVKINTDPKTFAVDEGGALRWVTSESIAISLFGSNWNTKVVDVPDAFWSNYKFGADIEAADDYSVADALIIDTDINDNKDLESPIIVTITDNKYDASEYTLDAGRAVRFVNNGASKHTATAMDLSWGSGTISPGGGHFSRYFKTAGDYEFFDSYFSTSPTATLIVE